MRSDTHEKKHPRFTPGPGLAIWGTYTRGGGGMLITKNTRLLLILVIIVLTISIQLCLLSFTPELGLAPQRARPGPSM